MGPSHPDIEAAVRRLRKAGGQLLDDSKPSDARPDPLREAMAWKTDQEVGRARSKARAQLRYDHAGDVNQVARAMPDFIAQMLERHIPVGPPLEPSFDRIAAERIIVERIFGMKELKPNPCQLTQPVIADAPFLWRAGETHTITGSAFGSVAGSVVLELDTPPGTIVPLTVQAWSNEAAMVAVPTASPSGIPLETFGKAVLTRSDASCSDAVNIRFEPLTRLLFARMSVSESGWAVWDPHSKSHTFTSPVVPPLALPFAPGILGTDVVLSLLSSELAVADDPPSFSVVSGPSFTANNERTITIRVSDDRVWNYRLTVDFLIVQPAAEVASSGWTAFA